MIGIGRRVRIISVEKPGQLGEVERVPVIEMAT